MGLLGIGNVSYGHWKAEQYSAILRKSPISVTAQDQNSKRLVATIEFYKVVIFGGRSLLGVGALALLIAFIARAHARKLRAKPQSTLNKLALDP